MSDAITDRMIILGRKINQDRPEYYATLNPDKEYLRVDYSGRSYFVSQSKFVQLDDQDVIKNIDAYFSK